MNAKKDQLITLKEAAEISGYTADYLGQLIRGGRLEGKQVFSNVAWMTTKEAVQEYLEKNKKKQDAPSASAWVQWKEWLLSLEGISAIYTAVAWCAVVIFGLFILFLAYVFAVSVDHRIERKHLQEWKPATQYEK